MILAETPQARVGRATRAQATVGRVSKRYEPGSEDFMGAVRFKNLAHPSRLGALCDTPDED
jgi:hypothetical protein